MHFKADAVSSTARFKCVVRLTCLKAGGCGTNRNSPSTKKNKIIAMKQKKFVSMIGALVLIIGAVVLIAGCPQPNSNKVNSGDNDNSNNLNGSAWFESGYHIGYYFLDGKVYAVDSNKWEKSFAGTVISFSVSGNILKINNREFLRVTDPNTLEKVKKAPIV